MRMGFTKMHGLGNDFVVLDARGLDRLDARGLDRLDARGPGLAAVHPSDAWMTPARATALADRRRGIGCDQLIVLEPSGRADAFMRIFNADGSEVAACGNATRCVAALIGGECAIETEAGVLHAGVRPDGQVRVDMGLPHLDWDAVPLARPMDTLHLDLQDDPAGCSMGNPHATFFTLDPDEAPRRGPALETDPLFPQRANIGFARVEAPDRIRLRVWERGAGLTPACGTGACAALVNAHRRGLAGRRATMLLDGGELEIEWREDGHVWMTGPVATAFQGVVDLGGYLA